MTIKESSEINEMLFAELQRIYTVIAKHSLPEAKIYNKGERIFQEGQIPKGVYYLNSGTVKITHHTDKKPVTVRLARAHDFVGYLSLLKHWDYITTATATENSALFFIPKQVFLKAVYSDNRFTNVLLDVLCNQINENYKHVVELVSKQVKQRLAILLLSLEQSTLFNTPQHDNQIYISKRDIAAVLNIKPETLSRNLADLNRQNIIRLHTDTNSIEILNRNQLVKISNMND
ncbi:MAG: Crp/Fnr family transcriptional regulator [Sediminibacterium sp.]|nr:Crp/Fnr family transcriptional regulator [Sediminibacterium sp.]